MTSTSPAHTAAPHESGRSGAGRVAAANGLVAGLLTVGLATLLAALLHQGGATSGEPAPVAAVSGAFVDRTPAWLKDLAISVFGTNDKRALLVGVAVVLAACCVLVGVLAQKRPAWALSAFALLGVVGAAAVLSRPGASVTDLVPTVVGTGLGLWFLHHGSGEATTAAAANPARRLLLGAAAGGSAAYVGGWLGGDSAAATASRDAAAREAARGTPVQVPAGADLGVPGTTPFVVPNSDFYRIDTAIVVPRLTAADWRLKVTGLVEREIELDWVTLQDKPMREALVTLACVSNEVGGDLIGNAVWTGWPVRELLALAGPRAGADMVLQTSADGWTCGTPLAALADDRNALLAVRMNGEPLPFEHGFPVRLVVPGLYGYVSACKWVTELKVTTFAADVGYWTPRGWSAEGPVKTSSRIDVPRTGAVVNAGRVAVAGVAWAQHRGITAVEVQVDDGAWKAARLATDASIDAWRQWVFEWEAQPGSHTLRVRATDADGRLQSAAERPPAPDGAEGLHTVTVRVE
ncbi:molybdopterin-dependent oxidoreductase [Intrasporangium calvum]|uniref:Molybdopterin-dependent oxidoreductase n=1 Tax=Intrasporangium calvum TaxID=53358 RepID=A0ABT5GKP5_9MICO|nr:molybdopterin-dependent oxidoreductase [Intrasporangium calvum]MDC5698643.1 molybdopterin-dependent oxidoreductase [Intrasporangium calvum]